MKFHIQQGFVNTAASLNSYKNVPGPFEIYKYNRNNKIIKYITILKKCDWSFKLISDVESTY